MTVNYSNQNWTIISTDDASDKPNLRKFWNQNGIAEMIVVTGQPKRKVWTFALYRMNDGSFRKVL